MGALGLTQTQGARDALEHQGRDLDVASLLKPCVPGDPDAGEQRDLFTPQSRRAPPGSRRQADLLRREPRPSAFQEGREIVASRGR